MQNIFLLWSKADCRGFQINNLHLILKCSVKRPCNHLLLPKHNHKRLFQIYFGLTRIAVLTLQKFWRTLKNYQDTRYKKHHNNWQRKQGAANIKYWRSAWDDLNMPAKSSMIFFQEERIYTQSTFYRYSQSTEK